MRVDELREAGAPSDLDPTADAKSLTARFVLHRERLRRMIHLRHSCRLLGPARSFDTLLETDFVIT